jgi:hypothetical protein
VNVTAGAFASIRAVLRRATKSALMQAQARKLSPRIVEGIQATKSAISSGTTSGWGSSLALRN